MLLFHFCSFIRTIELFSLITQLVRFSIAFFSFLMLGGSKHLKENIYINNLGYISQHLEFTNLTYYYTFLHFIGAIFWVCGLLFQKFVMWRMKKYPNYWMKSHTIIGYFLIANAFVMVFFGIIKTNTQKFMEIRIFFYLISVGLYFSTSIGLFYAMGLCGKKNMKELHAFWLTLGVETPVIISLWTEWTISFLQSDMFNLVSLFIQDEEIRWRFGELIGLWISVIIYVPFFSIPNFCK